MESNAQDAQGWDSRYGATGLVWSAEPNRLIADETGALAPGKALDVAAGEGRNAIWLASRGWTVTAVDFSAVALDKGRRIAEERGADIASRITWECADVRSYDPDERQFDLVVVAYLHLGSDGLEAAITRAAAGVADGGLLVVLGHDRTNIADGVGGPQDPAVLYGPDDIVAVLPPADAFVIERAERVRRAVAGRGHAIDAVVRARRRAPARTG